jgi:monoamine oxidase
MEVPAPLTIRCTFMTNSPSVVIVGAGAAGIVAARTLRARGVQSVLLEARNRVGGRAHTDVTTLGIPVDFGCAWLHSADGNPWTAYAREHGFGVIERDPLWRQRIGTHLTTPEWQATWMAAWGRNETLISQLVSSGRDAPVSEIVPDDEHRPLWDAIMTWLMGAESENVSAVDFDRYEDTMRNWPIREGFGSVIAHAARDLDVRLNTVVSLIDWTRKPLRVHSSGGEIECDAVIVTVPTTVLAHETLRFAPTLPALYGEAFAGLPLGADNKVFFEMEPGALPYEGTTNFIGTDRTSRTASYAVRPTGHDVLLAYFGGNLARDLEMRGELEVFARDELKSLFGSDFVGKITRAVGSAWSTDPFARGSYTVALPGKADLRAALSVPVADAIYFAGEANSVHHYGTANGAYESGVAAAERVIAALVAVANNK